MKTRIGVDYDECNILGTTVEISILKGLEVTENILFKNIKCVEDIMPHLILLCDMHDGKIYFESNRKLFYYLFAKHDALNYLADAPDMTTISKFTQKKKGIYITRSQVELWNRYKYLFQYDKDYEDSARIAGLGILNDRLMCRTIQKLELCMQEIDRLQQQIK